MDSPTLPFDVSTLQYVELNDYKAESLLRIKYLHDFLSILEKRKSDVLYRCRREEGASDFIFPSGGVTFVFDTFGYKTVADLLKGNQLGFAGCEKKFDAYRITNEMGETRSLEEGDVYYKATKLGYENLAEFEKAVSKGFGNVEYEKYRVAVISGFKNYDDYVSAKEMHLEHDASLFFEAKEVGLINEKEFEVYSRLKTIREQQRFDTFDKAQLFGILQRNDLGPANSLEDICNLLHAEKPRRDFGVTPRWYSQSFDDDLTQLEEFLSTNTSIAKLGSYDAKSRTFKKYPPSVDLPPMEQSSILESEYRKREGREKSKNVSLNWQLRD